MLLGWRALAGKTRLSPPRGATSPTQLAAVVQWLSAPPPSQVRVTPERRSNLPPATLAVGASRSSSPSSRSGADTRGHSAGRRDFFESRLRSHDANMPLLLYPVS